MKRKWIFYLLGLPLASPCLAQSIAPNILNAGGGTAVVAGNVHEWSIGEALIQTQTVGSSTVTQGLLQPTYVNNVSITEQTSGLQENLIMYPNPTTGNIFIQPTLSANSMIEFRVLDMSGKVLSQSKAMLGNGTETQTLDLNSFTSGMYILQVEWKQGINQQKAVYKIEKQ